MQELGALDNLYREVILDHYRAPRNAEPIDDFDVEAEAVNPFCGDEIKVQLRLRDGRVEAISMFGRGCSISQASGSLMTEVLEGASMEQTRELVRLFKALMKGEELSDAQLEELGDLEALQGVRQYPVRIKCALLAWAAVEDALRQLQAA